MGLGELSGLGRNLSREGLGCGRELSSAELWGPLVLHLPAARLTCGQSLPLPPTVGFGSVPVRPRRCRKC